MGSTHQYVVRLNEEDTELCCSQCGRDCDLLAKLPLTGFLRGWRKAIPLPAQPWIGLCEECMRSLLDGFAVARAKAATGDVPGEEQT